MNILKKHLLGWLTTVMLLAGSNTAMACATCFGKSDSKLAEGMNWGILSLLLVILGVLGGISAFFVYIARRSARVHASSGPVPSNS